MDRLTEHEAQRKAREALKSIVDVMFDYDPRSDIYTVRYSQITAREIERMVTEAVGRSDPLTAAEMESHISDALSRPREE